LRALGRALAITAWSLWSGLMLLVGFVPFAWAPARRSRWQGRVLRWWARGGLPILGVRVDWEGAPPPPPFVLVANHLSYLDILVLGSRLPAAFVARSDVASWPVLGYLARMAGTLFLDRERKRDLVQALERAKAMLRAGRGVIFFPEGTSSAGDTVLPFRTSLLALPVALALPVHAAALHYTTRPADPPARLAVCWWGDMTFPGHAWRMLQLREIGVAVRVVPTAVCGADRRQLGRELWDLVSEAKARIAAPPEAASPRLPRA
jgi:1-acyl-sn-glycerol-3-phosphate acyltransferase